MIMKNVMRLVQLHPRSINISNLLRSSPTLNLTTLTTLTILTTLTTLATLTVLTALATLTTPRVHLMTAG